MIKQLNEKLVEQANYNSFGGKRGDITEHEYKIYCDKVISWGLSTEKTQKILDKIYDYFCKKLSLDSQHISVAVAGASNYNAKKLDKSEQILNASNEFLNWFNELEEQATSKPYTRVEMLVKEISWGVKGNYDVNIKWKELAGRDRKTFNKLYEQLNEQKAFSTKTIPYKIYNNLIQIETIEQISVYSDDDLSVYQEQNYLFIDYKMKPQRQLIFAMKSRGFVWISSYGKWRGKATQENIDWVKTINEKYKNYI